MKVQIEGKTIQASYAKLRRMALDGRLQPWYYIRSDELTGGKWVRAGEVDLFAGLWGKPTGGVQQRQAAAPEPATIESAGAVSSTMMEGFRLEYSLACPKCSALLTRMGISRCPRCGHTIALSKQLYAFRKILVASVVVLMFIGSILFKKSAIWTKVAYGLGTLAIVLQPLLGRGAKLLVHVSIEGHRLPAKVLSIPLGEYYSPKFGEKLLARIKSAFRLRMLLHQLKSEGELEASDERSEA